MTWHRLMLTPQLAARAVRLIVAEQHIGGPLVGLVVVGVTAAAAILSGAAQMLVYALESGIAAEVALGLMLAAVAWWTWAGGYCR